MSWVYVLKCADNKYYVGETNNIQRRYKEHKRGRGANWTNEYPPIDIEWISSTYENLEDEKTIEYMERYGIDNVRGGSYCNMVLEEEEEDFIIDSIRSRRGYYIENHCYLCGTNHYPRRCLVCYRCHKRGHYSYECSTCHRCGEPGYSECPTCYKNRFTCYRCHKRGHYSYECPTCSGCGEPGYSECPTCYRNRRRRYNSSRHLICYRCGERGHYFYQCFNH